MMPPNIGRKASSSSGGAASTMISRSRLGSWGTERSAVFRGERLVRHRQVDDPLDERDDRGNGRPEEDQVQDPHPGLAQIEFVDADAPDQDGEQASRDPALAARGDGAEAIAAHLPAAAMR